MSKKIFSNSSLSIYFRLLTFVKKYWLTLAIGVFATILASAISALIIWSVKPIINKGLIAHNTHFLTLLPFLIIGIFIAQGIFNFISNYSISRVGRTVVMEFRQRIFKHLMLLPASFHDKQTVGRLISLIIYNVDQLAAATTDALLVIMQQSFIAIGSIVVMFIISWKLTLIFMVVVPFVIFVTNLMNRRLRKLSQNVQNAVGDVSHIARESIEGYKVIRTFGGEEYEMSKFNKATEINRNRELKAVITNSIGTATVQVICAMPLAFIVYIIGYGYLDISVGSFGAMVVAVLRLLTPIRRLTKITTVIQKGVAATESIFEILDLDLEKDKGKKSLKRSHGLIEYKNVSFVYPDTKKTVLENINFKAKPGTLIALVGHSGAGKSTLVNLLPRFYDTSFGEILIDNTNIKDFKLTDLRRQFSFVSQNIILFNDTVSKNIAYGRLEENLNENDIKQAAKAANILETIEQLPLGFDTKIGEQGMLLSGGQRQRIAIARAILKDAPILILDEATSALDTESEHYLQNSLEELMNKHTTLVIAHRLSTVEKADNIIVFDQGKIIEEGTHKELIKYDGHYAKLYKMQFSE